MRTNRIPLLLARRCSPALLALTLLGNSATAQTVVLTPGKDATLHQLIGDRSSGGGNFMMSGRTATGDRRRAVLAFDVAGAVPAGSIIQSASLKLHLSQSIALDFDCELHALLADWGEGVESAPLTPGQGAPASAGDATWDDAFFGSTAWATAGGDFSPTVSATTTVGINNGDYLFSTAQTAADVQQWLDNPGGNFGWLVQGDESLSMTAKRFDSRENPTVQDRPELTITYIDGSVVVPTLSPRGLLLLGLLLALAGALVMRSRRATPQRLRIERTAGGPRPS